MSTDSLNGDPRAQVLRARQVCKTWRLKLDSAAPGSMAWRDLFLSSLGISIQAAVCVIPGMDTANPDWRGAFKRLHLLGPDKMCELDAITEGAAPPGERRDPYSAELVTRVLQWCDSTAEVSIVNVRAPATEAFPIPATRSNPGVPASRLALRRPSRRT